MSRLPLTGLLLCLASSAGRGTGAVAQSDCAFSAGPGGAFGAGAAASMAQRTISALLAERRRLAVPWRRYVQHY